MNREDYLALVRIINEEIDKRNIPYYLTATVVTGGATSTNVTVTLVGSTANITIPNFSAQTLSTGNLVEVAIKDGNLNNAFVSHKH